MPYSVNEKGNTYATSEEQKVIVDLVKKVLDNKQTASDCDIEIEIDHLVEALYARELGEDKG